MVAIAAGLTPFAMAQMGGNTDATRTMSADEWLATVPDDRYTLQLATIFGFENCMSVAKRYYEEPLYCLESSTVKNRYFAVSGVYADKSAARKAAERRGISDYLINYVPNIMQTRCEMPSPNSLFDGQCASTSSADAVLADAAITGKETKVDAPQTVSGQQNRQSADQWLLSIPDYKYTIQLGTIFGYENCLSLEKQFDLESMYCLESSTVANRFFAVSGVFPSRSTAREAAQKMGVRDFLINYVPNILESRCDTPLAKSVYQDACGSDDEAVAHVNKPKIILASYNEESSGQIAAAEVDGHVSPEPSETFNAPASVQQSEKRNAKESDADRWLSQTPDDSYTVQLATIFGFDNCMSVAANYQLDSMYCLESSTVSNRYFAVSGVFESRSAARAGAEAMGASDFLINYLPAIIETRCDMPQNAETYGQRCPNYQVASISAETVSTGPALATSKPQEPPQPPKQDEGSLIKSKPVVRNREVAVSSGDAWLAAIPDDKYTIQLATIYGYENCMTVARQYNLASMFCLPSSTVKNRYFALTGIYPDRPSARQAAAEMGATDAFISYVPRIVATRCDIPTRSSAYDVHCGASQFVALTKTSSVEASTPSTPSPKPEPPHPASSSSQELIANEERSGIKPALDQFVTNSPNCAPLDESGKRPRRRPGYPVLVFDERDCDPSRLPLARTKLLPDPAPVPDRWRIMDTLGYEENLWDPYNNNNPIKGDKPIFGKPGKDWFANLSVISDSVYEPRRFPVPIGNATTTSAGQLDLIGEGDQYLLNQNFIVEGVLYRGDTVFRPPDHEFRLITVLNVNHTDVDERGLLKANPQSGTTRTESYLGIQGAFWDYHIRNVSDRYDFDSVRIGIQPFSSDFRGFLFQDNQLGVRLFGTRNNNIFQYNLAWFRRLEKESNSGLNDISELRKDDVFTANLYWQDFPRLGFISQASITHNRNREIDDFYFDHNQFIARPSSLGFERGRDYDITYLGLSGDGHFGRNNLTYSAYYAFGDQTNGVFTNEKTDVNAYFFAAEASRDYDWIRLKGSVLHTSGDDNPFDNKEKGFDAIFENPQFAGGDTAFFIRQNVPLIGGGRVALNGRNSIIPSLRSSKEHGQSNFTNPGLTLLGLGADFDFTPQTRLSINLNQMWFDDTSSLELARNQTNIDKNIGQDLSAALIYRPLATQNIVFRLSGAVLNPGKGFEDLYGSGTPYSVLANLILTY